MSNFMHGDQTAPKSTKTFSKQQILNDVARDPEAERLALNYLNRNAPDVIGMILGGVL